MKSAVGIVDVFKLLLILFSRLSRCDQERCKSGQESRIAGNMILPVDADGFPPDRIDPVDLLYLFCFFIQGRSGCLYGGRNLSGVGSSGHHPSLRGKLLHFFF